MPVFLTWFHEDMSKRRGADSDDEFNPDVKQVKRKAKTVSIPLTEHVRGDMHILKEHHDHLLSVPFDASFNGNDTIDLSSSQLDGGFDFYDNFFGGESDGLDIGGGIGDELARELGTVWGGSPVKTGME